jgi:molybdopterin converting factor small subunit
LNPTAINADASKVTPLEDEPVDTCLIATGHHDPAEVNVAEDELEEIARVLEDGEVRRFINIYVDGDDIRFSDGMATEVTDGAEVSIVPAVAGG